MLDISGRRLPELLPPANVDLDPIEKGLELAVKSGTAKDAFVGVDLIRFPIAGKTGSAEIGDVTPYAWFAAYAPATEPQYVVVALIERGRSGGIGAAPIVRSVFDRVLHLPRKPAPFPGPPLSAILLLFPLLAGMASPAAGSLVGLAVGFAGAPALGADPGYLGMTFAMSGWFAGATQGRLALTVSLTIAAALGSVALPQTGQDLGWIVARAGATGAIACVIVGIAVLVRRIRVARGRANP
jgi:penicillin-binding protein 2